MARREAVSYGTGPAGWLPPHSVPSTAAEVDIAGTNPDNQTPVTRYDDPPGVGRGRRRQSWLKIGARVLYQSSPI